MQEQRFDKISAIYHLLNDTSVTKSNSSSNLANDVSQTNNASASAWHILSDNQSLDKVNILYLFYQSHALSSYVQYRRGIEYGPHLNCNVDSFCNL